MTAFLLGLWLLGAVMAVPHAWGWDDWSNAPSFDFGWFVLCLIWPLALPMTWLSWLIVSVLAAAVPTAQPSVRPRRRRRYGRTLTWSAPNRAS